MAAMVPTHKARVRARACAERVRAACSAQARAVRRRVQFKRGQRQHSLLVIDACYLEVLWTQRPLHGLEHLRYLERLKMLLAPSAQSVLDHTERVEADEVLIDQLLAQRRPSL